MPVSDPTPLRFCGTLGARLSTEVPESTAVSKNTVGWLVWARTKNRLQQIPELVESQSVPASVLYELSPVEGRLTTKSQSPGGAAIRASGALESIHPCGASPASMRR